MVTSIGNKDRYFMMYKGMKPISFFKLRGHSLDIGCRQRMQALLKVVYFLLL